MSVAKGSIRGRVARVLCLRRGCFGRVKVCLRRGTSGEFSALRTRQFPADASIFPRLKVPRAACGVSCMGKSGRMAVAGHSAQYGGRDGTANQRLRGTHGRGRERSRRTARRSGGTGRRGDGDRSGPVLVGEKRLACTLEGTGA